MDRRGVRLLAGATLALTGVMAGHALVYQVAAFHHPHTDALEAAGHTHWPAPWLVAAVMAIVATLVYGCVCEERRSESSWSWVLPRVAAGQVAGFLLLEAGERAPLGIPPWHLLGEPVILTGLGVQLAAACAVTAVLLTARRIATWRANDAPHLWAWGLDIPHAPVPAIVLAPPRPDRGALTRRGPPVFS